MRGLKSLFTNPNIVCLVKGDHTVFLSIGDIALSFVTEYNASYTTQMANPPWEKEDGNEKVVPRQDDCWESS